MPKIFGFKIKRSFRIGMSIDLLLLMLISTSVFDLVPFQPIFQGNNLYTIFVFLMAYMYIKNMGFTFREGIAKHLTPLALIYASLFLSFIPAYVFYGQHLYHSLIVYRRALCFLLFPLLMSIRPTLKECRAAFYAFAFLYAAVSFIGTYYRPDWIPVPEGMEYVLVTDPLRALTGLHFIPIALVFALDQFRTTHRRKYLYISLFLFLVIFLTQNRTVLLSSFFIVVAAVLFNLPVQSRLVAEVLLLFLIAAIVVLGWGYVSALLDETALQLQDEDYNRVKAFHYFTNVRNGPLAFFLGNGFISGNVHSIMSDLRMEGIFNSDLGLIGLWHQFGLLFPLSVLFYTLKGCSSDHSFHVRGLAVHMLVSSMTMAYYFTFGSIAWLCFYFYFAESDEIYFLRRKERRKEESRKRLRIFRSVSV